MQCLMCHKEIGSDDLTDLLWRNDVLCHACRNEWKKIMKYDLFEGHSSLYLYAYEGGLKTALIQLKSGYDEALAKAFLYDVRKEVKKFTKGYRICIAPSTKKKKEIRGFHHLGKILEGANIPYEDPFSLYREESQQGKNRLERLQQTNNIYLAQPLTTKRICLFDDQMTTGSTLKGMMQALPKSCELKILCVARRNDGNVA